MEKTYLQTTDNVRLVRFTFAGEDKAVEIATSLVRNSKWFELMPLPDDEWDVDVKIENERFVERVLDAPCGECRGEFLHKDNCSQAGSFWSSAPGGKS